MEAFRIDFRFVFLTAWADLLSFIKETFINLGLGVLKMLLFSWKRALKETKTVTAQVHFLKSSVLLGKELEDDAHDDEHKHKSTHDTEKRRVHIGANGCIHRLRIWS